ncbi:MAG: acyl-CoA dehydrogenase family protein, partial [Pseudomonadota bacterium]
MVAPLRRALISAPLLRLLREIMPAMSDTEREALEAGTVWWEAELFGGNPNWEDLFSLPLPGLSDAEQAFLDGPVEKLCAMLDDWQITHERGDLPPAVWRYLKEQGFFGMIIPKSYGGLEFSAQAHSAVVMKVASRSITAAVTVMVPNSLGPAELLLHYGTEDQKNHYLPRLARGKEVPCFALTSPEAGSDASAMPDRGVVCRGEFQGKKNVLGIRLNWEKRYITLGPVATVLGLAFRLFDPEHLLGKQEELGITLALIPTDTPGVKIGTRHNPLDI